jgi:hypothetical protein
MPKELRPGILYVAKEYSAAAHLCPCGCGSKIKTPLGPTEWSLKETSRGPTLYPSIGNWQQNCQSHYWIIDGKIKWSEKLTPEEIAAGRRYEEERRISYFKDLYQKREGFLRKLWQRIKNIFK